jgi:hypothetical protein
MKQDEAIMGRSQDEAADASRSSRETESATANSDLSGIDARWRLQTERSFCYPA